MSSATSSLNPIPSLTFHLKSPSLASKFSPRLGQLSLKRPGNNPLEGSTTSNSGISFEFPTPGLIYSTSRGVIQHLSRDNVRRTSCIKWVHVPFESFLQVDPPAPTRQGGSHPLHTFLGFPPSHHMISMSLRDPADGREMPSNGKLFVAAQSSRGTRKITPPMYRSYITDVMPDIVFSLPDVPFNSLPHSQKRISKSIERSAQWLATILAPIALDSTIDVKHISANTITHPNSHSTSRPRLNVFLHMVGGTKPAARAAFTAALLEPLETKDKETVRLETLDEGVSGYVFDLVPLRTALLAELSENAASALVPHTTLAPIVQPSLTHYFAHLIQASLERLPVTKPRLVNTAHSPHEILTLIRDVGIDLFDTFWAQKAATWGVALDFRFPAPSEQGGQTDDTPGSQPSKKYEIGHNLYEGQFAHDFSRLADAFASESGHSMRDDASSTPSNNEGPPGVLTSCQCAACSPTWTNDPLIHSTLDQLEIALGTDGPARPYTRAYLHHLLHTHEMSAHALLVMHNLTVMDAFMCGIRDVLQREQDVEPNGSSASHSEQTPSALLGVNSHSLFAAEVARFEQTYDARLEVLNRAKICWAEVDRARGKGRLARERAKGHGDAVGLSVAVATADVEDVLE